MSDAVARLNSALEGRYAIERELGEGGMATVYLAKDLKHNRNVALKVLKPELAAVVGAERFLAEIKTTANLTHPHILPLHDSGEADGFLFYVMPYLEGESLRDRLDRDKQLPVDEAVALASKVAGALQHAHEPGVIHRDIKPGNILLQDGEPVVADFGIALALDTVGGTRLTQTGLSLGTPAYMSPEQASGLELDGRSDIYSLGCVLYEMLSGETPYSAPTPLALMAKKLSEPVPRVSVVRETVPAAVEHVITRALSKTPADRYDTAQQLVDALAQSAVTLAPAPQVAGRTRPRRLAAYAGAVVVAVLGGSWLLFGTLGPGVSTSFARFWNRISPSSGSRSRRRPCADSG